MRVRACKGELSPANQRVRFQKPVGKENGGRDERGDLSAGKNNLFGAVTFSGSAALMIKGGKIQRKERGLRKMESGRVAEEKAYEDG